MIGGWRGRDRYCRRREGGRSGVRKIRGWIWNEGAVELLV